MQLKKLQNLIMNKFFCGFILLLLQSASAYAMIFSFNSWGKGSKRVTVLGVCDGINVDANDFPLPRDKLHQLKRVHSNLVKGFVDTVARRPFKAQFILDAKQASDNFYDQYKAVVENCKLLLPLNDIIYWDFFAHNHTNNYKSLSFRRSDTFSTLITQLPLEITVDLFGQLNDEAVIRLSEKGYCNNDKERKLQKRKNKYFQLHGNRDRERIISFGNYSVGEFLLGLRTTSELVKSSQVPKAHEAFLQVYHLAEKFFEKYSKHYSETKVSKILWKLFKKKNVSSYRKQLNNWIFPVHILTSFLGVVCSLKDSVQKFDHTIVYCIHTRALKLNNYLQDSGFNVGILAGNQDIGLAHDNHFDLLSAQDLKTVINKEINGKRSNNAFACGYCYQNEDPKELKQCGSCKNIVYCSKECQREDWKNHQGLCKKKF